MSPFFLVLALFIQSAFSAENAAKAAKSASPAKEFAASFVDEKDLPRAVLQQEPLAADEVVPGVKEDWMDVFSAEQLQPSSAAATMAKVLTKTSTPEAQLETMKEMTKKMDSSVELDLFNLLASAMAGKEPSTGTNEIRKKRSIESPMDSSQLVMRLLKHIKSNNENQNIAIEKMMTAQEIADKYNIPFTADPEVLTNLATATTNNAKELSDIVAEAVSANAATPQIPATQDETYFIYSIYPENNQEVAFDAIPIFEFLPEQLPQQQRPVQNVPQSYFNPLDAPMPQHPHNHHNQPNNQVSAKPTFYETVVPSSGCNKFTPMEPMTIILPIEEVKPEPELVGEEFEEIVSSKVSIEPEAEPGCATVNHVTTYTLSEKAHFRTPHIEKMPEQMQYTFFLM